jgi:hypothetical protein
MNTAMMVELQRNTKKRTKPYQPADFYCWGGSGTSEPPEAGAAMLELMRRNLFPQFALGEWFDDLKNAAGDTPAPAILAWWSDEAILLAPRRLGPDQWGGYLIAMAESAGMTQTFTNEHGDSALLTVPPTVGTVGAVEAEADAVLPIG